MQVPLLDLTQQYQSLKKEIEPAVLALMASQRFVLGPPVAQFEKHIAEYHRCQWAVGVSSGTDALLCSLMALGVTAGDEVIVPTFTFFGSAGAIARTGARPVFVDVDPVTFNIDPAAVEKAITNRTKAIMPVHLFGQLAPMEELMPIAQAHGLAVIEDACQSIGAKRRGKATGQWGDCSCLSFYPSKNLAAFGDAGVILGNDQKLEQRCRALRMHGEDRRYYHSMVGGNFRLDALQALVLDIKLKHLAAWTDLRRRHAHIYDQRLQNIVTTPAILQDNDSVYNQYVIRAPRRDDLQHHLQKNNIGSAIYYPVPLHLQACFANLKGQPGDCPVAEQACHEVLALPVYPELTDDHINYVADCIAAFYKDN